MESLHKNLTGKILWALGLGLLSGLLLHAWVDDLENPIDRFLQSWVVEGFLQVLGKIFVLSLKMLVVPVVLVSLLVGVASLEDVRSLGRIGVRTLLFYLSTTAIAISLAIGSALVFNPGGGFEKQTDLQIEPVAAPSLTEVLINLVPANPIQSMAEGNMLQIIVFALLLGVAISLAGESGKRVFSWVSDLNVILLRWVDIVIYLAPVGVFCLVAKTFAEEGFSAIAPLAKYFFLVAGVLLVHGFLVYPSLLLVFGKLNPWCFLKKIFPVQLFAFSTASSNATIPVTLDRVQSKLGAGKTVASFTVPFGATINMDGTAIMQGVATVFIAQIYGVELGVSGCLSVVLTATLASIGTAGVPGVGLIMLTMVLQQVGLPVEAIAIVLGVDRLLDMLRTAINVTGDAAVTCIIARWEKKLDVTTYRQ